MSLDCDFQAVTATYTKKRHSRCVYCWFISYKIRHRLLEKKNFTLQAAFVKACPIETAQKSAKLYLPKSSHQINPFHNTKRQSDVEIIPIPQKKDLYFFPQSVIVQQIMRTNGKNALSVYYVFSSNFVTLLQAKIR